MADSSKCVTSFCWFVTLITRKRKNKREKDTLLSSWHDMARSLCDLIISSYSDMASFAHLQRIIAAQNEQINVLISERNWLEKENNIKRVTMIRLNDKIAGYERYLQDREAAMALELDKVRQHSKKREQQIQKQQSKKMQAIIARYRHWKRAYYRKEEEFNSMKGDMDRGHALCRVFPKRGLERTSGLSSGHDVNLVRVYGGYVDCTATLTQPDANLLWRVRILTCAAASRERTMGRLALPGPELDAVSPANQNCLRT